MVEKAVFSTLDSVENNEKSGFEIIINGISIFGHLFLKKYFLLLTFVRLLEHFENS